MTKIDSREKEDRLSVTDDEKKRAIDFWTLNLPVPEVGIHDEPTRCYKINLEWAKIVMGMVSWLADVAAWKEAQNEAYEPIRQIMEFLQGGDCVDCNDIADCLNQNPSFIGFQAVTYSQLVAATEEFLAQLEEQYTDSPQDINPIIPSDEPTVPAQNALCYAIKLWVDLYCEAKAAAIRNASLLSQVWNGIQGAMIDAYETVANGLGYLLPVDVFDCFIDFDEALVALADLDAREDVVCCLIGELQGITLLEGSMAGALEACMLGLGSNAHKIVCALSNDLTLPHTLNFFYIYGRALERQLAGEIFPPCQCIVGYYTFIEYDLFEHPFPFVAFVGAWQEDECYTGTDVDPDPDFVTLVSHIIATYTGTLPKIVGMGAEVDRVDTQIDGQDNLTIQYSADGITWDGYGQNHFGDVGSHTFKRTTFGDAVNATKARVINTVRDDATDNPSVHTCKVRIWLALDSPIQGVPSGFTTLPFYTNTDSEDYWKWYT